MARERRGKQPTGKSRMAGHCIAFRRDRQGKEFLVQRCACASRRDSRAILPPLFRAHWPLPRRDIGIQFSFAVELYVYDACNFVSRPVRPRCAFMIDLCVYIYIYKYIYIFPAQYELNFGRGQRKRERERNSYITSLLVRSQSATGNRQRGKKLTGLKSVPRIVAVKST